GRKPQRRLGPAVSSARDELGVVGSPLVGIPGLLEQLAPGGHVGAAAEQGTALAFGHAAPNPELDPVVEGVREALGTDDAATADQLGPVLRRPLNKQLVRIRLLARGAGSPVSDPHVVQLLLIVTASGGSSPRVAFHYRSGPGAVAPVPVA